MTESGSGENTQTSADAPSATQGSPCALESGSVIKDRYRIIEPLGRGGKEEKWSDNKTGGGIQRI